MKPFYSTHIVLTNQEFPVDKALILLGEIQSKIIENFPKIMHEEEEETLAGAKIYASDICSRFTLGEEEEHSPAERKVQEAQQKVHEEAIQLQLQMPVSKNEGGMHGGEVTAENPPTMRRKVFFGVFLLACVLYIIVPIIDSVV